MRVCDVFLGCSLIGVVVPSSLLLGQSPPLLAGCEPHIEVRKTLEEKLSWQELQKMKFTDQMVRSQEVLGELIAKYPREVEPHRRLLQETRWWDPEQFPTLREHYQKQAEQNPQDPLALYLAGVALFRTSTIESIRLLEEAKTKAPDFPWPSLQLAEIYSTGKRADKKKAAENLASYFAVCPDSTNRSAQWLLGKLGTADLQCRTAAALRTRLAKETEPARLKEYETLWGLEFRTRPPQEHEKLRKQIGEDVKRLEPLNTKPDAEWLAFLKNGYKQSGASQETITAIDDRRLREFPKSEEACGILADRWRKEHKEPEDHKDAAAWAKYKEAYKQAVQDWIRDFPDVRYVAGRAWFYTIKDGESISEREGIAAMEAYLKVSTEYEQPGPWNYIEAAEFLVQHKCQPQRALGLLRQAEELSAKARTQTQQNDNLSAQELEEMESDEVYEQQLLAGLTLRASKQAGEPDEVQSLKTSIEGPVPKQKKHESDHWLNRARLAALEDHKADALTYYQLALHSRQELPQHWRGKLEDPLTEEAQALWKGMGGTENAWEIWCKRPDTKSQELAEGRWEKPNKELPAFELTDLSGNMWRLKDLEGKSLLINLWATWCGPCQAELPHLQKLYEKVKDRNDLRVLSFNIDEELGLVAPYLKEKGYTFPVLTAYSFVMNLLDSIGIPQNWIVDPKGTWKWTQVGFGGDANWEDSMIQRLEALPK